MSRSHASVHSVLRYLGFGRRDIVAVPADSEGRMLADELDARLKGASGAKIVVARAGQISTGAFDPLRQIATLAQRHDAWLHVDGAFGLWARACPNLRLYAKVPSLPTHGAVDGHKCGLMYQAHQARMRFLHKAANPLQPPPR